MKELRWESGTKAQAEGKDLPSVARTLSDDELEYWTDKLWERLMGWEARILEAEQDRRGKDHGAGPLFRGAEHG